MTSIPPISERDIERLSAYLDNHLPPAEEAHLETRLASEAALRRMLDDLRWTRAALRRLPQLRAPRNFTLDPREHAAPRRAGIALPSLRLATALASALFALVVGVDLWGRTSFGVQEAAPAAESLRESATAAIAQAVEAPSQPPAEFATPVAIAPQEDQTTAQPGLALSAAGEADVPAGAPAMERAEPGAPAPTRAAPEAMAPTAVLTPPPSQPTSTPPPPVSRPPTGWAISPLRALEIGLGLAVILLAIANLAVHRR